MRLCTLRMLCVAGAARCQQPCAWVISFQTSCPPTNSPLPFYLLPHSYYFFLLQSNYQSPSGHPFFSASQYHILPVFCYLIPTQPVAKKCCENQAHTWGRVHFPDYSSQISLPLPLPSPHHSLSECSLLPSQYLKQYPTVLSVCSPVCCLSFS